MFLLVPFASLGRGSRAGETRKEPEEGGALGSQASRPKPNEETNGACLAFATCIGVQGLP